MSAIDNNISQQILYMVRPYKSNFSVKSCRDHMNDIWNKDNRYCKVSKKTVCFLDQGKQTELGDPEIYDTADERRNDLFSCNLKSLLSGRLFFFFGFTRRLYL